MPRPGNYRESFQVKPGAVSPFDVDVTKRSTVDKDGVLVLVGEDVPPQQVEHLVKLAAERAKRYG